MRRTPPPRDSNRNNNRQSEQPDQTGEPHNVEPLFRMGDNLIKGMHYLGHNTQI